MKKKTENFWFGHIFIVESNLALLQSTKHNWNIEIRKNTKKDYNRAHNSQQAFLFSDEDNQ